MASTKPSGELPPAVQQAISDLLGQARASGVTVLDVRHAARQIQNGHRDGPQELERLCGAIAIAAAESGFGVEL